MKNTGFVLVVFLSLVSPALAQFVGLGDLPGGSIYSTGLAVSSDGTVVMDRLWSAHLTRQLRSER